MAWTSPETKMDTGQLYVTTDGEHYTPVSELGTNPDLSIEECKWCCDELAEMYLSGDLDNTFCAILPRRNGKMIFQRMLEWALEEHGCKVYRARALSGYPTIAVKPCELYDVEVFPNLSVVHKVSPEGKIYKRSVLTKDDLEDCLKEELKPKAVYISSTGTIKENFAYEYLGKSSEISTNLRLKHSHDMIDATISAFKNYNQLNHNAICRIKTNNEKETKKMNARKCERCGKLYEVTEWPETIEAGNENLNRTPVRFKYMELPPDIMKDLNESGLEKRQTAPITINKVLQPARYESKQEAVTLCPHCLRSLKDWFEMKEETVIKEAET